MFEPILRMFNGFLSRFGKNILGNRRNGKDKTELLKLHNGGTCYICKNSRIIRLFLQWFHSVCYCPITDLDHADMAYEWLYGNYQWAAGDFTENILVRTFSYYMPSAKSLFLGIRYLRKSQYLCTRKQDRGRNGIYSSLSRKAWNKKQRISEKQSLPISFLTYYIIRWKYLLIFISLKNVLGPSYNYSLWYHKLFSSKTEITLIW